MNISVVIHTLDNPDYVFDVITQLNQQLLLPSEIVIVDSSSKDDIEKLSKNLFQLNMKLQESQQK